VQTRKASSLDTPPALSGRISRVSIADLLSTLEGRGASAVVRFSTASGPASIWFVQGRLVDAEMGVLTGEAALFRVLGLNEGRFEVVNESSPRSRVIHEPIATLIAKRSRRAARWEDLVFGGPALDGIPARLTPSPNRPVESPEDRRLLKLINGSRTLLEVLDESALDPVQALEALGRLQNEGHFAIERSSTSRPPPPRPEPPSEREPARRSSWVPELEGPRRAATLMGLPAASLGSDSQPPRDSRPPETDRARVATLMGPADDSWFEPRSPHASSASLGAADPAAPDSSPSIVVEPAPDESGLMDTRLRAGRSAESVGPPPRDSWPSVDVGVERPSAPPAAEGWRPQSVVPSIPPPSGVAGLGWPGAQIGPYQVLFRLAHGRQSSVYLCRETEHGSVRHLFAVKVIEQQATSELALDEFNAAAQRAAILVHPNVARFLSTGSIDGRALIVSEYVEGCSLAALLRRHSEVQSRPIPLLLAILFDALRGLQAAHELPGMELWHGALCPRDLLLGYDGVCRVADLHANHALRAAGLFESSPDPAKLAYTAPECLRGRSPDARSDVFSMGAIIYEALSGIEPFGAATAEAVSMRLLEAKVEPPSQVGMHPPAVFDEVCLRALERDPDRRFGSIRELLLALEHAALEHDTLASSTEVAAWIGATFGRELELRRLSILDASRRSRAGRGGGSSVPPPAGLTGPLPSLPPPAKATTLATLPSADLALLSESKATRAIVPVPSRALAMPDSEIDALMEAARRRSPIGAVVWGILAVAALAAGAFWILGREASAPVSAPEPAEPVLAAPPAATPPIPPPPAVTVEGDGAPVGAAATPPAHARVEADRAQPGSDATRDRRRSSNPGLARPRVLPRRIAIGEPLPATPPAQPAPTPAPPEPVRDGAPLPPADADEPPMPPPLGESATDSDYRYGI
jgi:serine/threonine protein kinase